MLSHVQLSVTPWNCSLPVSSVLGIFQARTLEQSAISFSRGSSQPRDRTHVSCISYIGRQILYRYCQLRTPYVCEKKGKVSVAKLRLTLCDPTDGNSSVHVILQARNTGVVSHSLLQGIFSTQGSNPSLLRCRQTAPSESPGKPMLHIAETKPVEMEWSRT